MKSPAILAVASLWLSGWTVAGQIAPCTWATNTLQGREAFQLSNGLVSLWIVPSLGGRIVHCQLENEEFLRLSTNALNPLDPEKLPSAENKTRTIDGGDVLGLAPVGRENDQQWLGPENSVLDQGSYRAEISAPSRFLVSLTLTSPVDATTGMRFQRTINLYAGSTVVHVENSMKNAGTRPARWSLNERTQFVPYEVSPTGRVSRDLRAVVSLRPAASTNDLLVAVASTNSPLSSMQIDAASHLLSVQLEPQLNRLELPGADGWMAVFSGSNGACLAQHFTVVKGGRYPDRLPAAIWFNGPGELSLHGKFYHNPDQPNATPVFLETQIFSPMVDLRPGQDFHFEIEWCLTRCPTPVAQFTPAGILHQPLRLARQETSFQLTGILGVFYQGHLEAVIKARDGSILANENLGLVDPRKTCVLDRTLDLPKQARKVLVLLLDEDETHRGTLAELEINNQAMDRN